MQAAQYTNLMSLSLPARVAQKLES